MSASLRIVAAVLGASFLCVALGCGQGTPPAGQQPKPQAPAAKPAEPKEADRPPVAPPAAESKKVEPSPAPAPTAEPKKAEPAPAPAPAPAPEAKKPEPAAAADLKPGLQALYYKFDEGEEANFLPADSKKKPDVSRVDAQVNFESVDGEFGGSGLADKFHTVWSGVIRIEKAGSCKFYLNSDDGSRLKIDGKDVVDNSGLHGMEEKDGTVELTAGDHAIAVEFFENDGGAGCILSWEPAGGAKEVVPAKVLFHKEAPAATK